MKRFALVLAIIAAIFAASCVSQPSIPANADVKIVVLHTNDTHGHPIAFDNGMGGFPAIATLVEQTRAENKNVLYLDAGDFNTGLAVSNFFKAEPDIKGFNFIKADAVAIGNHEFDNDVATFETQKAQAEFPIISANVKTKDGKYIADAPYIVKEFDGIKVGVFGLTTTDAKLLSNPAIVGDLVFEDEIETAKNMVKVLREKEKCHIVILLGHLGTVASTNPGVDTSIAIANNVPGIDLIVDGHSHDKMAEARIENNVPIVAANEWGKYVGKGVLEIKNGAVNFTWEPISINHKDSNKQPVGPQFAPNAELDAALQAYNAQVEEKLQEKIGVASATFTNADKIGRKQETALGDIVADAMKFVTSANGTDFAIQNGGGIRADLPAGDITLKSIYTVLPFDNTVQVIKIKGSDLVELFDSFIPSKIGQGAYSQVSDGISYTINTATGKCENVLIGGNPLDLEKIYTIATNDYMATGGDGYTMFAKAISSYSTSKYLRDALVEYIISIGGTIEPKVAGRVTIK